MTGEGENPNDTRPENTASKAQRATGPKTQRGKKRSSRNALKHGAYSTRLVAIPNGPFVEDEVELELYVSELVASYEPRDAAEIAHARRLAMAMVKLERLDRYEAYGLAADGEVGGIPLPGFPSPQLDARHRGALHLLQYVDGDLGEDQISFEELARFIAARKAPKVRLPGLWDEHAEPASESEWMRAYRSLVNHHWPPTENDWDAGLLSWATLEYVLATEEKLAAGNKRTYAAAGRSLATTLPRVVALRTQLVRQYVTLLATYELLRCRWMPGED